jgi:hypothetical protein
MIHVLTSLIYVDLLIAAGLLLLRLVLPLRYRALVSPRLVAVALTTPAVALLSGNIYLFFLFVAAVIAMIPRARLEFLLTVLALLPSVLLMVKETHAMRLITLATLVAIGVGVLVDALAARHRYRGLPRHGVATWIVVGLFACFAAGTGHGRFLGRILTGASVVRDAVLPKAGAFRGDSSVSGDVTSVGTNLYSNQYWSPEFPFLNRMKTAGAWAAQGADSSQIPLTADGYPIGRPAGTTNLYTMIALDPVTTSSNNTYVLTWTGSASFFIAGGQVVSSSPGRIVFNFTRTDTNQTFISVDGLDPAHPLDNMAIVRSDQVDLYNSGEIFNPAFVSKVSQLGTLRFMDWNDTNENKVANWSDRTSVNNYSWESSAKSGVPIEVEVALANEAKTDMWLNVPTYASDDYVRQMVTYVHDHLNPSLSLHLEYSNEVWNWSFQQSHYASDQADALWGNGQHYGPGWVTWYGYRAAQVANIANQVYGSDASRLHTVLATQTGYEGLESYIVDGVARANLGSVAQLFDDYAVTTYFGGNLTGENDADRATILGWAKAGDAGVTAAIAALKGNTGLTATDGSLAWLKGVLAYQGAEAQTLGLNLVAYEGGVDLTQGLSAYGADAQLVTDFLNKVKDDPRMADVYTQMTTDFAAAGGKLLNIYTDTGAGYGTLKSIYDTGSPEWNALVAAESAARRTIGGRASLHPPGAGSSPSS